MFILFDLDGTLLRAPHVGVPAFLDAFRDTFGVRPGDQGRRFAGGLDPQIYRTLCAEAGVGPPHRYHDAFRRRYAERLARRIAEGGEVRALEGALRLVRRLAARRDVALGVLTGNYPETGRLKLEAAGFEPEVFVAGAFGTDGVSRRMLPRVAALRLRERTGRRVRPDEVVVVGDTPRDVDCAKAFGARCLAVATGPFEARDLSGADAVLPSLEHAEDALAQWMAVRP